MMITQFIAVLAAALLLAAAGPASAVPMAYEFTGVVDWITNPSGVVDSSIYAGAQFSGRFTFDSEAEDSLPNGYVGAYGGPSFWMQIEIGSYAWHSGEGNGSILVVNDNFGHDSLGFGVPPFVVEGNVRIDMSAGLTDNTGNAFSTDALPLEQGLHVEGIRVVDGATFKLGGSFDSFTIVPEPSTVLFLVFGLVIRP
jgi:hypothetical protein